MLKFYRNFQLVQYNWIRNHPGQYLALNAILLTGLAGYVKYLTRKEKREIDAAIAQQQS